MTDGLVDGRAGAPGTSGGFRSQQRVIHRLVLLVLVVAGLAGLNAAAAFALNTHSFAGSFGVAGSGDGQLALAATNPNAGSSGSGVAVNFTTHNVYVADTGNARVVEFSSAGVFIRAFGANVGGSGVNVCSTGCVAGTPGSGAGALSTPTFIAVDNSGGASQGDVYVADSNDKRVTKFNAAGVLVASWGAGGQLDGSTATGGPFGPLAGITTDISGNVFVYDTNAGMFEFAQDGSFTTDFNSGFGVLPSGIAVDSADNLYIVRGSEYVEKITSTGVDVGQVTVEAGIFGATGLAVDPITDDFYSGEFSNPMQIRHYADTSCAATADCVAQDIFGAGDLNTMGGLAVDSSDGKVYVSDPGGERIAVFAPIILADATTTPASNLAATAATLNGHLDPAGGTAVSDCHFQYIDDAALTANNLAENGGHPGGSLHSHDFDGAATAPCVEGSSFSAAADVHADVTGLSPDTTYHERLILTNGDGSTTAGEQTFTTTPAVALTISPANPVGTTTATLHGHVDSGAGGDITDCHYEYLTEADLAANHVLANQAHNSGDPVDSSHDFDGATPAPCVPVTPISSPTDVTAALTGLTGGTTYHVRLLATNDNGTSRTADQPFTTAGPAIDQAWSTNIAGDSATLHGLVTPNGHDTTYHFEYGSNTSYGASRPVPDANLDGDEHQQLTIRADVGAFHLTFEGDTTSDLPYNVSAADLQQALRSLPAIGGPNVSVTGGPGSLDRSSPYVIAFVGDLANTDVPELVVADGTPSLSGGISGGHSILTTLPTGPVSLQLTGLAPATTYHFRLVATNSTGAVFGSDHTFITRPASSNPPHSCPQLAPRSGYGASLPDCRAYEQVSPTEKNSTDAIDLLDGLPQDAARSTPLGGKLLFATFGNSFGNQSGSPFSDYYISQRSSSGWTTTGINPPLFRPTYALSDPYKDLAFTPDLTRAVLLNRTPALTDDATTAQNNIYRSDLTDPAHPTYEVLTPAGANAAIRKGASEDLSHVVFIDPAGLTPDAPLVQLATADDGSPVYGANLYDWADGHLSLVNIDPAGDPIPASALDTHPGGNFFPMNPRMVSADGSRIFFQAAGNLYVRENGTSTNQLDASQGSGPGGGGGFITASKDGSQAFFTDDASAGLTSDTVPGSGRNLYHYDLGSGDLTNLTPTPDAGLQGVVGASNDASYVYFVANGVLAPGATPGHCAPGASDQSCNLYQLHDGGTTFVGALLDRDHADWTTGPNSDGGPPQGPVAITPDGAHIAFNSQASLTGYDNVAASGDCGDNVLGAAQILGPRCNEVYLYDATANGGGGALTCVSCNPTGARPQGSSFLSVESLDFGSPTFLQYGTHSISDDGQRLFFNSIDALTTRDANSANGCKSTGVFAGSNYPCQDVYQWEAAGSGSCDATGENGGCLDLLSTGNDGSGAVFLDSNSDGSDAFIGTRAALVGQDTDNLYDVYDARVGGGIAAQNAVSPPVCSGESCRGSVTAEPDRPAPASVAFSGSGSPVVGAASFTVAKVTGAQQRALAKTGRLTLEVHASDAGTVSATATATVGKRVVKVASARAPLGDGATVKLVLTLTKSARAQLSRAGKLTVKIDVTYSKVAVHKTATLKLTTAKKATTKGRKRTASARKGGRS